jgi:hypothetical protein
MPFFLFTISAEKRKGMIGPVAILRDLNVYDSRILGSSPKRLAADFFE